MGLQKVEPVQTQKAAIPDIKPMRRGRPTAGGTNEPKTANSDPFAALDSKSYNTRIAAVEELSGKFPSLEKFSLLHDKGTNFKFTSASPTSTDGKADLSKRVTEALADEAFAVPKTTRTGPITGRSLSPAVNQKRESSMQPPPRSQPVEPLLKAGMISTGTMTSPLPSPNLKASDRAPIWRVPQNRSPKDLPLRNFPEKEPDDLELPPRPESSHRKSLLERARTKSQTALALPKPFSSRTSLDGQRPTETMEPITKSKSDVARARPSSAFLDSSTDISSNRRDTFDNSRKSTPNIESSDDEPPEDPIASDISFLKSIESHEEPGKRKSRRRSSSNSEKKKRTSIPSISLSGTKSMLAGKFGEAFRRFETSGSASSDKSQEDFESRQNLNAPLSPIVGSEATGTSGQSDDEHETQELSPEVRRELERRRLSQEEERVAAAGAEYKRRLHAGNKAMLPNKASSIQNRVKTLLNDTKSSANVLRTAEGYGKYTDDAKTPTTTVNRKPAPYSDPSKAASVPPPLMQKPIVLVQQLPQVVNRTGPRPSIAPKPLALRTGASNTPDTGSPIRVTAANGQEVDEDWESKFSKRYPSLSGIEMVETEIKPGMARSRDV
jgi:AP2-associated kinase